MILTEYISVQINGSALNYWRNKVSTIKVGEIIRVPPSELPAGSRARVIARCDLCGIEREINYRDYRPNCPSCARKGKKRPNLNMKKENHPRWSGGWQNKYKCKSCGKNVSHGKEYCVGCHRKLFNSGVNNPRYNNELTDNDRADRRKDRNYIDWAKSVKTFGRYRCQVCGYTGNRLVSHHLESWKENMER